MSQVHVMHITYDMRIGGTEMVIKNIIDGLTKPKSDTNHQSGNDTDHDSQESTGRPSKDDADHHSQADADRHSQDDAGRHSHDVADRHSRSILVGNPNNKQSHPINNTNCNTQDDTNRHSQNDADLHSQDDADRHSQDDTNRHSQNDADRHSQDDTDRHSQDDTDHHSRDDTERHSRDGLIGNPQSLDPRLKPHGDDDFKMSVLCIESPLGPFSEELKQNGIEFFELNRQPGFDTNLIKQIRQTIKNNQVDIIHCHQYTPWVYGVIAAAFTKTKVIFTEHGRFYPDSSTWKRKLINPILNLFTDQVTAISKATKQALVEFENIPEKSIEVIYNGIAPLKIEPSEVNKLRSALSIPTEHLVLGTIARFDPIKNHTMMLRAFSLVLEQHANTTLIIVGDGDERTNIEACIKQLDISNSVILTGYQTKPQSYLALMDIYLLSSLSEGTSMTLLEAMSLGKPCVVTDAGGNPEIVINNENGLVTPNDNIDKFAQGIMTVLYSAASASELGKASKNRFNAVFSEQSMNTKYQQLYQQLIPVLSSGDFKHKNQDV